MSANIALSWAQTLNLLVWRHTPFWRSGSLYYSHLWSLLIVSSWYISPYRYIGSYYVSTYCTERIAKNDISYVLAIKSISHKNNCGEKVGLCAVQHMNLSAVKTKCLAHSGSILAVKCFTQSFILQTSGIFRWMGSHVWGLCAVPLWSQPASLAPPQGGLASLKVLF